MDFGYDYRQHVGLFSSLVIPAACRQAVSLLTSHRVWPGRI